MTVKEILDTAKEKMGKSCAVYERDMQALRTGRANPKLLDRITVDYYGTPTPLNQIGNVTVPEARMMVINQLDRENASFEKTMAAINEKFGEYCDKIATAVILNNPADVEALKESEFEGAKVADVLTDAIHVIGENMQVARFAYVEPAQTGAIVSYNHMNNKIGVLVSFATGKAETTATDAFKAMGADVAMHIAAMNPVSLDKDSVPAEVAQHELEIYKAQAAESGKPENIQEKIAEGRMSKFYKENCLLAQDFVKDPDKTVEQYVAGVAKELGDTIEVVSYVRMALGE